VAETWTQNYRAQYGEVLECGPTPKSAIIALAAKMPWGGGTGWPIDEIRRGEEMPRAEALKDAFARGAAEQRAIVHRLNAACIVGVNATCAPEPPESLGWRDGR
jgi:hypothetical protein